MDIKFKNRTSPIFMIIIILLFSVTFCSYAEKNSYRNIYYDYDNSDSSMFYFANVTIQDEAIRYVKNLNRFYVYFKNFDIDKAYETIEKIESKKIALPNDIQIAVTQSLEENYAHPGTKYSDDEELSAEKVVIDEAVVTEEIYMESPPEYYYENILEVKSVSELNEMYTKLKEVTENYEEVKNYLENVDYFVYYLYNSKEDKAYTNGSESFNEAEFYETIDINNYIYEGIIFNGSNLQTSFKRNNFTELKIGIPFDTENDSFIYREINNMQKNIYVRSINEKTFPILLIISIAAFLFTVKIYKSSIIYYSNKIYNILVKLPLTIKCLALLFSVGYLMSYIEGGSNFTYIILERQFIYLFAYISIVALIFIYLVFIVQYLLNIIKNPKMLKNELELKICSGLLTDCKYIFSVHNYITILMFAFTLLCALGGVFFYLLFILDNNYYFDQFLVVSILLFIFLSIAILFIKLLQAYSKISYYITEISKGNINNIPDSNKLFLKPLSNLNNINDNVKKTIDEMIKNERLKTELITNVSHDLKTPLTSIVNYIDLLKDMALNDQKAVDYINVISQKSMRLKILIEDLFEASKLSTGQLQLNIESADIVSLLNQTLGELNNKIEGSGIEFKIKIPEHPIFLNIDGQRMWRVFENLLNNIIKYAQDKSRAYISIEDNESDVTITMKNVSAYPLDFNPDELFERFKRGDSSRSTEGSGLGLSIAKSIVELHNGKMDIIIDGDLFKIIIILNK